jgi:hypothetical protein
LSFAEVPSLEEQRANTIVTMHWYYTNEVAAVTDNVQAEIELFTQNANTGYSNSGIPLELQIKCIELLPTFTETSDPSGMLETFRTIKGIHETRSQLNFFGCALSILCQNLFLYNFEFSGSLSATKNTADIAFLMVSGPKSGVCGVAYLNAHTNNYSFGWVGKGCQTVVTGHEVGHNFGATHNREISSSGVEGFEYGYLIPGGYASIMA